MYVAFLGPGAIYGKDRRDNACIRRRGVQKDEEWGQRWCCGRFRRASMGPGVQKGLGYTFSSPRASSHHLNGGHHGIDSDCCPPLVRIQITLGLPAYLAWPLCLPCVGEHHLQFHLQRRSQISTRNTRGGYMYGLLALYGQSEGSHTFCVGRLAIRTCTPPVRHDSPFQLVARFQSLAPIGQTTHRPFGSNCDIGISYRSRDPDKLHVAWTVGHLTSSLSSPSLIG
jgi:hypothetical protein